jgi:hypothetical protein
MKSVQALETIAPMITTTSKIILFMTASFRVERGSQRPVKWASSMRRDRGGSG